MSGRGFWHRAAATLGVGVTLTVLALAGLTWWALEADSVALVTTRTPEGGQRETHVWYVEQDGVIWLEAGTPDNAWYRDVLRDPRLGLSIEGERREWLAQPVDDPGRRAWLRAALRGRYGIRDWWVARFVDAARSVPVRLAPAG